MISNGRAWRTAGLVTGGLLFLGPASAQLVPPPVVNPATYDSRSGAYQLEVDPSEMHGSGPATYRLSRAGATVWSGQRPFTLIEAAVADDGVVAGYAYSGGAGGYAEKDRVHLLILDARGHARLDEQMPRRDSRVIHGGPEPVVGGLVFDPDHDRVVFRVSNVGEEEVWRTHRLSTGKALTRFEPSQMMGASTLGLAVMDAQAVAGTPLTLVHWWRQDWERQEWGARYTLVDPAGRPVWQLDLPRDYVAPAGDRQAAEALRRLAAVSGILDVNHRGEFEIRVTATSERVRHRIEDHGAGRWHVQEVGRAPWERAAPRAMDEALRVAPEKPLRHLGTIRLGGPPDPAGPGVRQVHDFDVDDEGRFGFARQIRPCTLSFVLALPSGQVLREAELGSLGQEGCGWSHVAWAGGTTWLVTAEYAGGESGTAGWWVDGRGGDPRPLRLAAGVSVRAVAGRPGGVALLGQQATPGMFGGGSEEVLIWLDTQGRELRRLDAAALTAAGLLSPEDLAVASTGETLVLDVIRHLVVAFDGRGALARTTDLQQAWKREPKYPSGIAVDADGGFVVEDFAAGIPFVRMNADGTVRGELRPRYEDGRPTGRLFRVRAARDGVLWGSDGEALLALGEDGLVQRAVGNAASAEALGEVAAATLDAADRIYAADRRTGAVHVFDGAGQPLRVCRPESGDVEETLERPVLGVTGDGRVLLRVDNGVGDTGRFLEFSPSGQRLARHAWSGQARFWNSATGGYWQVDWRELALLDGEGQVLGTVRRRADRRWLVFVSGAAVAPDGSIAVMASLERDPWEPEGSSLNIYAADGRPLRMIELPGDVASWPFAFDGHRAAVWRAGEIVILGAPGAPLARFRPRLPGREVGDWPLLLPAGAAELWLLDPSAHSLERFELP